MISIIGLVTGFLSGLLGVGGAVVIVPALVLLLNFNQHSAQGTALFTIVPTALVGAIIYTQKGNVDIKIGLVLMITTVLGSIVGSLIAGMLPAEFLKRMFGLLMLLIGLKFLFF